MIQFGRELQGLNEQLCREYGKNATHKKMLQVPEGEKSGEGEEGQAWEVSHKIRLVHCVTMTHK